MNEDNPSIKVLALYDAGKEVTLKELEFLTKASNSQRRTLNFILCLADMGLLVGNSNNVLHPANFKISGTGKDFLSKVRQLHYLERHCSV